MRDCAAWKATILEGSILDSPSRAVHWAEATRRKAIGSYGRWLSFLERQGWLDPQAHPADRVTPERVKAYIDSLRDMVRDYTLAGYVTELRKVMAVLAPDRDWRWIDRPGGHCLRARLTMAKRQLNLPSIEELGAVGIKLMMTAETLAGAARRRGQFRDGLMFALLAAIQVRLRNLTDFRIGRNLVPCGEGYRFIFEAAETKTSIVHEGPIPPELTGFIRTYLTIYRRELLRGKNHDALWVNWNGQPLGKRGVEKRFRWITHARFGRALGPHAFRHAAATTAAIKDPAHIGIMPAVLGHRSAGTAEAHYNRARMIEAARRVQSNTRRVKQDLSTRADQIVHVSKPIRIRSG